MHSSEIKVFVAALRQFLSPSQLMEDLPRRMAFSGDASFYQLLPELVVTIENLEQMQQLLRCASQFDVPLTFRAAGTSLSGQAVTDSVLVLLSDAWNQGRVNDDGSKVSLQPGVIGAHANRLLKPYGRKIGPDPASIDTCKVGGIAANNASGMCCGVKQNSYHTLADMQVVFADGSCLDTSDQASCERFIRQHPELVEGIKQLAAEVKESTSLADKIRHKYRLKNTTGYGINALLDFEQPIDILKHLLIGSEGTLGFIADITYHTVADEPYRASGLYVFEHISACCEAVGLLAELPVSAVELMDSRALKSVADKPAMPKGMDKLDAQASALLIEVSAADSSELESQLQQVSQCLEQYQQNLLATVPFSQEQARNKALWDIRKGTFPAVGAVRQAGTTVIIEDVAFPLDKMPEGVARLQALFETFGYDEGIIFGHALEGNLHFVFTQAFDSDAEVQRYADFMQAIGQLVAVDMGGSLKAEHGTGRNMAPFVKLEWGEQAYAVMQRIKQLFDPKNILNPGVILNDDPDVHVKHLKAIPSVQPDIDKCIECGFCEPVCPSKGLTLSPRQRIAMYRKMQSSQLNKAELQQLEQAYQYQGIDTCAATGLCAQRCPVGINTGDFIKSLRAEKPNGKWLAAKAADHFPATSQIARFALNTVHASHSLLGGKATETLFNGLNKVSANRIPKWYPAWPAGAGKAAVDKSDKKRKVVYFPSCANRIFAADPQAEDQRPLQQVLSSLLAKAGMQLIQPQDINQLCCGQPWDSKGHSELAGKKRNETIDALLNLAREENLPVLVDASPCAMQLKGQPDELQIFETAEFLQQFVMPHLTVTAQTEPVMLHISCSAKRMAVEQHLLDIAHACSEKVIVPDDVHCCGFAGDKGFFTPELNANGLKQLQKQVPSDCKQGVSNSRTCEIGLSQHAGVPYQSIVYLLDRVSVAKETADEAH